MAILGLALGGCQRAVLSDGQVLRDAQANAPQDYNVMDADGVHAMYGIRDFVVESITIDSYEKDVAKAIVRYKMGGNIIARLGLTYRYELSGFWRLEGTYDLGVAFQ